MEAIMPKNTCWCYHCLTASGRQKKFDKEKGKDKAKHRISDNEYLDDINDLFPWIPRGEFKRVKD